MKNKNKTLKKNCLLKKALIEKSLFEEQMLRKALLSCSLTYQNTESNQYKPIQIKISPKERQDCTKIRRRSLSRSISQSNFNYQRQNNKKITASRLFCLKFIEQEKKEKRLKEHLLKYQHYLYKSAQKKGRSQLKNMISPYQFQRYQCTSPNLARIRKSNSLKMQLKRNPTRQQIRDCIFRQVKNCQNISRQDCITKESLMNYLKEKPFTLIAMGINQTFELLNQDIQDFSSENPKKLNKYEFQALWNQFQTKYKCKNLSII